MSNPPGTPPAEEEYKIKLNDDNILVEVQRRLGADAVKMLPDDLQVFVGLLGQSDIDGYRRLYLTLGLNECIEFAERDVLHAADLGSRDVTGQVVWLKKDAEVRYIRSMSVGRQRGFLQGPIAQGYGRHHVGIPWRAQGGASFGFCMPDDYTLTPACGGGHTYTGGSCVEGTRTLVGCT